MREVFGSSQNCVGDAGAALVSPVPVAVLAEIEVAYASSYL